MYDSPPAGDEGGVGSRIFAFISLGFRVHIISRKYTGGKGLARERVRVLQ